MIKAKQTPPDWAAPHPVMPQTDRAKGKSGKAAEDSEGSALNIIFNGHNRENGSKFLDIA